MAQERVNYYTGQRLDADDFRAEQHYQDRVRRLLNHGLFTPGVVEGLEVSRIMAGATPAPRTVRVSPGTALDALGRLIVLDEQQDVPLPNQLPLGGTKYYYLILRYAEEPMPGRADECAAPGTAPATRIREQHALDWSEVIPFPRPADPEDSIEQGVIIALVELNADCTIAGIDPSARRLSFPRNVSRVQAVAFEGEKDIAQGNSKKLYFHIRGGPPSSVRLYLRGDKFSSTAYTESGTHTHALSHVAVKDADVTTQDHHHNIVQHHHQLVHEDENLGEKEGMKEDGDHIHPLLTRALIPGHGYPKVAVDTEDYAGETKAYYVQGWDNNNLNSFPRYYMLGPSTKGEGKNYRDDDETAWGTELRLHAHDVKVKDGGPTSTEAMKEVPATAPHHHQLDGDPDLVGSTGYELRGGTAHTYPTDVRVALDGKDITSQLVSALQTTWGHVGTLGGDEMHPFNQQGTGQLDLVELGLSFGPGEHWLEFSAATVPTGQPPVGGKIIYNLYID